MTKRYTQLTCILFFDLSGSGYRQNQPDLFIPSVHHPTEMKMATTTNVTLQNHSPLLSFSAVLCSETERLCQNE
jgi:hypothetical protein